MARKVDDENFERMPGPWRITFDTNPDSCNINCIMCEEHSQYRNEQTEEVNGKNPRIMNPDIIRSVISTAAQHGLKEIIPSTMGEPLLYPWFDEFITLAKQFDLKVNLTTNGTFPNGGATHWGRLILPVASDVKISINSNLRSTNEPIMSGITHTEQMENIERFITLRDEIRLSKVNYPTVTFQATFMESNLDDLPGLVKMAISMGADRVKGHHLWITWPELEKESLKRDSHSRKRWNDMVDNLHTIVKTSPKEDGTILILENVLPLFDIYRDGELVPKDWQCPFTSHEAWISWDGTFNVCCCPDDIRSGFGKFGNVNETDFMELWRGNAYSNFINGWGTYKICQSCNMRRPMKEETLC